MRLGSWWVTVPIIRSAGIPACYGYINETMLPSLPTGVFINANHSGN